MLAFLAVFRESIETAFIVYASAATATTAVTVRRRPARARRPRCVLGFAIYKGAVKINLAVFFKWTGALLILVAAGIFAYGFHDLQEANILPGLQHAGLRHLARDPAGQLVRRTAEGHLQLQPGADRARGDRLGSPTSSR